MIAENNNGVQDWSGASPEVNADNAGKSNEGIATESGGRKTASELYKKDVLGEIAKKKKNNIWKRGGEKRIRYKDE